MHADGETDGGSASEPSAEPEPPEPGSSRGDPAGPAATVIDVRCPASAVAPDDLAWIHDRAEAVVTRIVDKHERSIERCTVKIVGDAEMSAAHERFSQVSGPTDVLTFVSESDDGIEIDVLACLDEASRRVESFDHDVKHELLLYIVHGVLHAVGYDDHEPASHARMHAEEDRLLAEIGVGAVFRVDEGDE